ncbi:pentatricopeptide repeat-containing protein At3g18110, chloroplastic [Carica papaya]|uniref:pentatricopeptide repeat-containing protein At3g18110, chloroplastic n=1 Tax=Carica papaya TaxID=3649 RepID=UPI000B8C849D|nr:pentatricopeptide repeat-containing protein At3g18110, chloroplastic [Carica papaya]
MAAYNGVTAFLSLHPKIWKTSSLSFSSSSVHHFPSCRSNISSDSTTSSDEQVNTDNSGGDITHKFSYSRASPSVRWPHLKLPDASSSSSPQTQLTAASPPSTLLVEEAGSSVYTSVSGDSVMVGAEKEEVLGRPSRNRVKKMTKLALKRAKDWRERVKLVSDRIFGLEQGKLVGDVLDDLVVQMTPTDFCFVVKWVGQRNWERALEVYEWLNLRHWYAPNARMLATVLAVLGRANQEGLAEEIFMRAEPAVGNTVQVYNAMMGVYARNGRFSHVQQLLDLMRERGCEPDLVSFNTLINARFKSGAAVPNLAMELLNEVRRSGLRPDIITYNTLISACSRGLNLVEAMKVYHDMEAHGCQPDLWTYNAMISVYGRCGLANNAEQLFKELESKGLFPDAVTYNSLLYAFAREGDVEKVQNLCQEMLKMGFVKDEMTYNTIIHMYGKQGDHGLALKLYEAMKRSSQTPDVVTYTVLIDSLGKANKITEAANIMSEMLDAGVKPTLRTYSALICGYAKAGKQLEAEETFSCMLRSGIRPDHLAYSVMLDIFLRFNETKKAMVLYKEMVSDGYVPDNSFYETMIRQLKRENKMEDIQKVVRDMEQLCSMNPQAISYLLVKAECYDHAAKYLKLAISSGYEVDRENLLTILTSYILADRHSEAHNLLKFLREHKSGSSQVISEALIVMHCKTHQPEAALQEYSHNWELHWFCGSCAVYESLIQCCKENEFFAEASQIFSDMRFCSVEPSEFLYQSMVTIYCKLGFPETADHVVNLAETRGINFENSSIYIDIIEAYGKVKLLEKAESIVGSLRQRCKTMDLKVWNALIQAYANNGCYERARAVFSTMMRDGPFPTVDSINGLLQALIVDGRLDELYVLINELQDLGFKISRSSILLILDAFVQAGNIFEVKKIYNGMKAVGYFPTMYLYRIMIKLLCKGKRVRDVEVMISEMEEAGFEPDLSIWNSMLRLYAGIEDFKKTAQVYQRILETGFRPDEVTYNTLIVMYCRDRRPEERVVTDE